MMKLTVCMYQLRFEMGVMQPFAIRYTDAEESVIDTFLRCLIITCGLNLSFSFCKVAVISLREVSGSSSRQTIPIQTEARAD